MSYNTAIQFNPHLQNSTTATTYLYNTSIGRIIVGDSRPITELDCMECREYFDCKYNKDQHDEIIHLKKYKEMTKEADGQ